MYLSCIGIYAQKSLVDDALKQGPDQRGVYHIKNSKKKSVSYQQTVSYLKQKGYIPLGGTSMRVQRFGDVSTILDYCDFTDSQNSSAYIFSSLSDNNSSYSQLKKKGSFFLAMDEEKVKRLKRWDNVLWTGSIFDGFVDGNGEGFLKTDAGDCYWFKGVFDNGIPISTIQMKMARSSDAKEVSSGNYSAATAQVCVLNLDADEPSLLKALRNHAQNAYKNDAKKVEQAYQIAHTLNTSNYEQYESQSGVIKYKDIVQLIAFYGHEKINYDPDQMLLKAKAVELVLLVIPALQMKIRDTYYEADAWEKFFRQPWRRGEVADDANCLDAGLQAAKKGEADSRYGLQSFFSEASELLKAKKENFDKKVSRDRAAYDAEFARRNAIEKQWLAASNKAREKFENENRIDWNKSEEPSGELVRGFLSSDYSYLNSGKIVRKDGKKFGYNEWFDYNKKHKCYKINDGPGLFLNEYKSWDDMIEAIENF